MWVLKLFAVRWKSDITPLIMNTIFISNAYNYYYLNSSTVEWFKTSIYFFRPFSPSYPNLHHLHPFCHIKREKKKQSDFLGKKSEEMGWFAENDGSVHNNNLLCGSMTIFKVYYQNEKLHRIKRTTANTIIKEISFIYENSFVNANSNG